MLFLRSFVFAILFYSNLALWLILCMPLLALPPRYLFPIAKGWAKSSLWLLKVIVGLGVEWRGLENIPKGGVLVVAKHQSAWETFALVTKFDRPVFILKQELTHLPIFGWFIRRIGMIPVDRSAGLSALSSMARNAREKVQQGHQVIIFPEGTRRAPDAPPNYRTGVSFLYDNMNAPCLPVALNSGIFWARQSFLRRPGTITVSFLPPLPNGLPRKEVLAEIQNRIETETNRLMADADPSFAKKRQQA